MCQPVRSRKRIGFSMLEMLIAVGLMLIVFSLAIPFFIAQAHSIDDTAGRQDAQQTARFAISAIDRDLRVAGAGVVDHVHLHVVPRWAGDTNFMPVLADVKVLPEHLAVTRRKLAAAFSR